MVPLYFASILLCLIPLSTAFLAWRLACNQTRNSTSFRAICFYCGVAISSLTSLVMITCMVDPFPVVHSPNGSDSIPLLDFAYQAAYGGAFLSIVLALFGKGGSRILLALSGARLVLLALGGG